MVRWGVALTSFTLKVFFIFWSTGIAFDQFYFEDGDQNIASNPRYRGISQTRFFAICSDYILYLFRLYLIFVPIIFNICSDYILYLFRLYFIFVQISSSSHACSMNIVHFDDIIIYNITCWSLWLFVEISIWTFGEKARLLGQLRLQRTRGWDTCSNAFVCISHQTLSSYCHCIDFSM